MKALVRWKLAVIFLTTFTVAGQPVLMPPGLQNNRWVRLEGRSPTNCLVTLQASTNLRDWREIALLDQRALDPVTGEICSTNEWFSFLDPAGRDLEWRFYRFSASPVAPESDWKNQALLPNDAFLSLPSGDENGESIRWIKFAILLSDTNRVYYQDSQKYLLHHDFASVRLAPFQGMSRAAFDQVSLFLTNQNILLGTVLVPPRADLPEYGIQFAGRDPYPREMIRRYFELVSSTVLAPPGTTPFYFPAYEQGPTAALDQSYLASHGIRLSSVQRWLRGNQVYAAGWSLGRLKFISASDMAAAYGDGRLRPADVLLTDGVPAEIPFVSGIISLAPATPNSHAAILAGSYHIPFVWLADPSDQARALALNGQEVVLQGYFQDGVARVQLLKVEGALDDWLRTELLAFKTPPPPRLAPKARYGSFSAPAEGLVPDDTRFFGGKAAHFGLLRRVLPSNSPPAMAFSFDLWDAFMEQVLPGGQSLRAEIDGRLSAHRYPPDVIALRRDLAAIRDLITGPAQFNAEHRQAILAALSPFDPNRKIRFRSSSNAEDNETFTAAGLYDSYSGCLADDLDGDSGGPCWCEAAEGKERGVFRAIQKVYASFYNDNAFLERLRRGLDESQVAMGLLVHHSTPDPEEMANGVATVRQETPRFGSPQLQVTLVTQAGAVSVANPQGNARPEVVEASEFGPALKASSSLVPLGDYVLDWPSEYEALAALLFSVYNQYRPPAGSSNASFALNFEYKKVLPGKLLVKQARPLPAEDQTARPIYLLNEPTTYWPYQSEFSEVLANHRLKCFLTLQNRSIRLAESNLLERLYTEAAFEYRVGTNLLTLSGALHSWPNATHTVTNDPRRGLVVVDGWTAGDGPDQRRFELTSVIPLGGSSLFLRQAEIRKWLTVTYSHSVPVLDGRGQETAVSREQIQLIARPDRASLQPSETVAFELTNGISLTLSFLNSTNASGPPLGIDKNFWGTYPAALSPWTHCRISGLISEPIELRGYYSQSSRPGHKFRYAWHVFEPRLEPGLPASQLRQLQEADIELIYISREAWPGGEVTAMILGPDGKFRILKRNQVQPQ